MTKINVAIIEPSPVIGYGLRTTLEMYAPEFNVAEIYRDIPSFQRLKHKNFDIVLLNPILVGFSRHFDVRELFPDRADVLLIAIPYRYINPDVLASFDGVVDIYDDGGEMAKQLKTIVRNTSNDDKADISEREREIVVAIAQGLSNKNIADSLCISPHTVMSHRKKIALKLGLKGTAGFTAYAMINNLIKS